VARLTEGVRLFANYGEGFKPPEPNQVNNGFANIVANYRSIPNPDLEPETSSSIEGGARLSGASWSASATAFSSRFRNFIDQVQISGNFTAADPATYQFINRGRVKIEGVEGRAEARLPMGLGVRAAASYARGEMRTDGVAGEQPLDSIEPVKVIAGVFYQPDRGPFRAEVIATHSAGKDLEDTNNSCNAPARPPSPPFDPGAPATQCFTPNGFWVFDAVASVRVMEQATLRVGVFNITDRKYFWWSDVRGLTSTSTIRDAYSQPGRKVSASIAVSF
jgi:hemoglobin/transferrin/lactoferrin receptor protein